VFPPPTTVTPTTFILENESRPHHPEALPLVDPYIAGGSPLPFASGNLKPARPRHRMSSEKLETLDAIFRRNTHPSRKEKEVICKDLEV
jgi:Homeodomain